MARQIWKNEVQDDSAFSGRGRFLKTWGGQRSRPRECKGRKEELKGNRALWGLTDGPAALYKWCLEMKSSGVQIVGVYVGLVYMEVSLRDSSNEVPGHF